MSNPFDQPVHKKIESISKEVGYDIPIEAVSLPSKGLLYTPDHPLYNEKDVEIKALSAKEEDLLTNTSLIKKGTLYNELMKSCLINKSVNPDDLLMGDRNAIMIGLRITGYGAQYEAKVSCPSCDQVCEHAFDLSQLKLKPVGATPLAANSNLFSFTLPVSKLEVKFKLLTGKDDRDMDQEAERLKKAGMGDNAVTRLLRQSIVEFNGVTERDKLVYMIQNMRAGDSSALRQHISKIRPDVEMSQMFVCASCGTESEVEIPIGIRFFWPSYS